MNRNLIVLLCGVVFGIGVSIGSGVLAQKEQAATSVPIDELRTFTEVFARIKNDYVEEVDDKTLLENAIRGMLTGLDPHSTYLDTEEFTELQVGTSGQFGGLGIEVTMEDGFVKVVSPIDDTPAQRAGMQSGDLIIRLDDAPVKGMTLNDAVKVMRGEPGTKIELTVVRSGLDKPLKVSIERAIIKVKSVKQRILEDGFGYVRISQFRSKTGKNLNDAISKLKEENEGPLKGMVLDLRNNPGGVLNAAVGVSDAFLEKGLIVYTEGRIDDSQMKFNAKPGDEIDGAPLVVLVNGGSASASEIVAGALQDHKRALVVGTKSFGKGSVQTILPMNNRAGIKLTTARYFTPSGRSIQAEGIEPDIIFERLKVESAENPEVRSIKEADLTGHLDNGNGDEKSTEESKVDDDEEKEEESLASKDYPLYQALNLLKGMAIQREHGM